MEISNLEINPTILQDKNFSKVYSSFEKLINELRERKLPEEIIHSVNWFVNQVNSFKSSEKDIPKKLKRFQASILKLIEKELKLVPKNHYRKLWLAVGMAAFGIPFGVVFGLALGNMAFLGIGIPIGMGIGVAIGTALDQKARESGNQLNTEIS